MKKRLSPMMTHYMSLKEQYGDVILLYRLGDFYEMFFDDAIKASKILDLTLTGRDCGLEERAPMCGVPYHAVDSYIAKLLASGNKVAICEQLSTPSDQKGMVKRDVIRVITAGTVIEEELLEAKSNNFLVSVYIKNGIGAVAWSDIAKGEIKLKEFAKSSSPFELEDFLMSLSPREIIANKEAVNASESFLTVQTGKMVKFSEYFEYAFDFEVASQAVLKQLSAFDLTAYGLENKKLAVCAAGALIEYVNNTQKRSLSHINSLEYIKDNDFMFLDYNTKRNLELFETLSERKRFGSLIWVLDETKSSMGARMLKEWLNSPLQSVPEIEYRLSAVTELLKNDKVSAQLGELLSNIRDIERLVAKISYNSITPKDVLSIRESIEQIPPIKKALGSAKSDMLRDIFAKLNELPDLYEKLSSALSDNPPATLKDGAIFKKGYSKDLDTQRYIQKSGAKLMSEFEARQREITKVNVKVAYNRIFGYYIEVPKSKESEAYIPPEYIRKQTVASGERYTTEELENLQNNILNAAENCINIEIKLFEEIREFLRDFIQPLQKNAKLLAQLDCLYSLAQVGKIYGYSKPKITNNQRLKISGGRHPVVEKLLKANEFVSNDAILDNKENQMIILTGPNMAGKSTYIRQVALITLLAHIGSYVPCEEAEIPIVDRIFTRVGASDNLVQGQSTFMVEMLEVTNIINHATSKSLLILDEIGRGTSTLDGLSIAWAIAEYILTDIRAKALFATHYHELTELEKLMDGVKNYRVLIQETSTSIAFLYKIARGSANKSYGIEVAALSGIKPKIIERAKDIMSVLLKTHELSGNLETRLSDMVKTDSSVVGTQMSLFDEDPVLAEIKAILKDLNINKCTPIEALTILNDMKKLIGERKK